MQVSRLPGWRGRVHRTSRAGQPWRGRSLSVLALLALVGASQVAGAQEVLDLAQGKWTTGLIGECRTRYYQWSVRGDTLQFRDQAGQIDLERIIDTGGNLLRTETIDSAHRRRGGEREGTQWTYRFSRGGDIVQVSSSTGKRFTLTRCP